MQFLRKIGSWLSKIFGRESWLLKKAIPVAIEAVNKIKDFDAKNPEFADLITAAIPGTLDDILKDRLRKGLHLALLKVDTFHHCKGDVACIVRQIQSIVDLDIRAFKWSEIAAHTAKFMSGDGKLDINEIAALVKMAYENPENSLP